MKLNILYLSSLLLFPVGLFANELDSGDTGWILTSTALVLFMTLPGLALFYAGLVRSKNILSVLMQCFTLACVVSVIWVVAGYSLAFKGSNPFIGNLDYFLLANLTRESLSGSIPESVFIIFQMTFAIITPALVVGAFAERMRFTAMVIFSSIWLLLVYIPACHLIWGGGYLGELGVIDFAGGLVVHATCGIAALVCAIVLGQRREFNTQSIIPHNRSMVVMGAAMLWVGWFGFNAGSALSASTDAGMAILVTHISAAMGALAWMGIEWFKQGKPTVVGIATGMVAGLASITPAAGTVGPQGALLIGLMGGTICYLATQYIKSVLKIDDSLDVFPVHGVGGILGILMLSFLSAESVLGAGASGLNASSAMNQFYIQLQGVVLIVIWTLVFTWVALKITSFFTPLRVTEEDEVQGLDLTQHNEMNLID